MYRNDKFEELYQSLIQKQVKQPLKQPLQNVSIQERSYRPVEYEIFKRTTVASIQIVSETIIMGSQPSAKLTYSLKREGTVIGATASEQIATSICESEDILLVKEELHQESSLVYSGLSSNNMTCAQSLGRDDHESECSISQYTCEATDGYQSGESKMSDVQRLCKDCKILYKKVRKWKQPDIIEDPHNTDPRAWCSKSWIFVNHITARGSKKKRNILTSKEEQKRLLLENQGGRKRKNRTHNRKTRMNKSRPSNYREESQTGKKDRKSFSYVLESQEEDADPKMKRFKLETNNRMKLPLKPCESENLSTGGGLHKPETTVTDQSSLVGSNGHNATAPSIYSVQAGSFREQLEKLKKGCVKSAVVTES
ncbi:hypothetical protein GDO81_017202 [Engystomops pustulosus]|uniref:Uncharacterized protein n=1 Tax=Engystomops pustulosus TaxID=76066 RepID=A0AAV7AC74_ENGPU|nr:hypothetical protein GDO81_017202 [Engystomops pustulosus]